MSILCILFFPCINPDTICVSILSSLMYQSCHYSCICINPDKLMYQSYHHSCVCINPLTTPASVSILSSVLYQFCHHSCINPVIVPVSILSSLLYQFCQHSCIAVSILSKLLYQSSLLSLPCFWKRWLRSNWTFTFVSTRRYSLSRGPYLDVGP